MRFLLTAIIFALASHTVASAEVIFQDDFEAHPLGANIFGLSPQIGPVWRSSGPTHIGDVTAASLTDQHLTLVAPPGSGTPYVYAEVTSQARLVELTFDLHVAPGTVVDGAGLFALDADILLDGIALTNSGFFAASTTILPKSDLAGDYKLAVTMYFDTDEIEVWVDDLSTSVVGDATLRTNTIVPISSLQGIDFEWPFGSTGAISIDNVLVVAVPEPSGFVLMLMGAAFISSRRRAC
jgi:hypothetical protein